MSVEFDIEYDVVVVGGGASGKSAAYTVKTESDLSVVLLEKREKTGGTSACTEGMCAFESSIQKRLAEDPDNDTKWPTKHDGYRNLMVGSHYRANPDVVSMFVENCAETIDIYESLGLKYEFVGIYVYDNPEELASFHKPEGMGNGAQEVLLRACVNAGVEIFTSTDVQNLIMENGQILGVEAVDAEGNVLKIGAKAVVLATGGYAQNDEYCNQFAWHRGLAEHRTHPMPIRNEGCGLKLGLQAGADTYGIGALMNICVARNKGFGTNLQCSCTQPSLAVNKRGARCLDESLCMSFADYANVVSKQPGCDLFMIYDQALINKLVEEGSLVNIGIHLKKGRKLDRLPVEIEQAIEDGVAWKGDTITELAEAIGIDPVCFEATVARYNELCELGEDKDFFKNAEYLNPISEGPFYCVNVAAATLVSCGSVRVNGNLQAVDADYNAIPGLYAVGNDAIGMYGDAYALTVPGVANGFAHTSGRVAARHIIEALA